jgi:hypothetical protein
MPIDLTDRISLDAKDLRRTADGYMVANPRVARTGIQLYRGSEVGRPTLDVVRVYRPEEQVFAKDSMHTFAYKPITNNHPPVPVTADNWTKYAVGNSGGEVARDGEAVRVPMVVMDKAAIKEVEDGKSQLSVGYSTELVWGQGTSPQGETYDAMQTAIRVNHIAIVDAARGGDKLKLGDTVELFASLTNPADPAANVGDQHMAEVPQKTTTIVVDSISLEMSDTAAAVVNRSIKDLTDKLNSSVASVASITADAAKAKTEAEATIAKMTADHKVAVDALTAKVDALTKQVTDSTLTPAKLDQLVKDRAEVFGKAKAILGDKLVVDGKSIADVQRQVVSAQLGDVAKDYTDEQVKISFDTLTAKVKVDAAATGVTDTARAFSAPVVNAADKSAMYAARDKKLQQRYLGASAK